jgi:uncharacterized delta-60 repeat protein
MSTTFRIKSGTTSIPGSTVKGNFSYFSGSTRDLGPSNVTGFYSGIDAPLGAYTIYQIGGPDGWTARVANTNTELNSILTGAGATGTTLNNKITWATNTNTISIISGITTSYYLAGDFISVNDLTSVYAASLNSDGSSNYLFGSGNSFDFGVFSSKFQSDGKLLVGGTFTSYQNLTQNCLIRLNTDFSKDTSFNIGTGFDNSVYAIAIQSDGKILVGGDFTLYNGSTQNKLIRLNSDGSKDTSFNIGTGFSGFSLTVKTIIIQSDGKILVGGNFTSYQDLTQNYLVRLNSDGSKDTSFDIGTGFNGLVYSIDIQSDGKILAGGSFTTFTGSTQNRLIRLNSNGTKDTSFDIGTGFTGSSLPHVYSVAIQPDNKIIVGGNFTSYQDLTQTRLIRLNSNGTKDTSFDIGNGFGSTIFFSINILSSGKILLGGGLTGRRTGSPLYFFIRLNSDGSQDTSLNVGVGFNDNVETISINSEGKIFAGGYFDTFSGSSQSRLIKTLNYSLDTSFNVGTGFNGNLDKIAVQSDGKILVAGGFTSYNSLTGNTYFMRLNSDGTKDTSFDAGDFNQGDGLNGVPSSIVIQTDGKIVAGGLFTQFSGLSQSSLIRFNSDGSKDTSFDIGAGFSSDVYSIAIQSDGKILAGGEFTTFTAKDCMVVHCTSTFFKIFEDFRRISSCYKFVCRIWFDAQISQFG